MRAAPSLLLRERFYAEGIVVRRSEASGAAGASVRSRAVAGRMKNSPRENVSPAHSTLPVSTVKITPFALVSARGAASCHRSTWNSAHDTIVSPEGCASAGSWSAKLIEASEQWRREEFGSIRDVAMLHIRREQLRAALAAVEKKVEQP